MKNVTWFRYTSGMNIFIALGGEAASTANDVHESGVINDPELHYCRKIVENCKFLSSTHCSINVMRIIERLTLLSTGPLQYTMFLYDLFIWFLIPYYLGMTRNAHPYCFSRSLSRLISSELQYCLNDIVKNFMQICLPQYDYISTGKWSFLHFALFIIGEVSWLFASCWNDSKSTKSANKTKAETENVQRRDWSCEGFERNGRYCWSNSGYWCLLCSILILTALIHLPQPSSKSSPSF